MVLSADSKWLLVLLSAFVALGPLSTDMYLPALPAMIEIFDTNLSSVQLTISAYLAGFAVFHLLCGPLSDRFGRKPILIVGLVIFCVSCVGCALVTSIDELIIWRFIQGVGACTGPTLGRAMVRDIYGPVKAAKGLAYMAAIMALAPVIAPTLGGWMLSFMSWSSIFWFLGAYGLVGIIVITLLLPESLPSPQSLHPVTIIKNFVKLLVDGRFNLHVLAASCLYAGAFAFISGSSFILIDFMNVAAENFGLWFMFIVLGYMAGNLFTARFSQRFESCHLMLGGGFLGLSAGLTMVGFCLLEIYHPLMIVLPVACYTGAVGITMPHAMAAAMAPFPAIAGTASALMGFVQMTIASFAGVSVGFFLVDEPLPMALIICICGALATLLFWIISITSRPSADK
mgnify:FL=1